MIGSLLSVSSYLNALTVKVFLQSYVNNRLQYWDLNSSCKVLLSFETVARSVNLALRDFVFKQYIPACLCGWKVKSMLKPLVSNILTFKWPWPMQTNTLTLTVTSYHLILNHVYFGQPDCGALASRDVFLDHGCFVMHFC